MKKNYESPKFDLLLKVKEDILSASVDNDNIVYDEFDQQ